MVWVISNLTYVGLHTHTRVQEDNQYYNLTVHELPPRAPMLLALIAWLLPRNLGASPETNVCCSLDPQEHHSEMLKKWLEFVYFQDRKLLDEGSVRAQDPWSKHRQGQQTSKNSWGKPNQSLPHLRQPRVSCQRWDCEAWHRQVKCLKATARVCILCRNLAPGRTPETKKVSRCARDSCVG